MGRRFTRSLVALLTGLLLMCGLSACDTVGIQDDEVIRKGVTQELELLKDTSEDGLAKYIGGIDFDGKEYLEEYGVDSSEMLEHLLGRFDYELKDIEVDGTTASAQVVITNVDIANAVRQATQSMTEGEKSAKLTELYLAGDDTAYMQQIFAYLFEGIDGETKTVTTEVTLSLTKDGSSWTIDDSSIQELYSAAFGGLDMSSLMGEGE